MIRMLNIIIIFIIEMQRKLVDLLPTNCYSTVCKLSKMTHFSDANEKMRDMLSQCDDARVINHQLLSYIIAKCAGNVLLLRDVLENVVSTDKKKELQIFGNVKASCCVIYSS